MKNILLALALIVFIGCKDKKKEDLILDMNKSQKEMSKKEEAVLTQNIDAPFSLNFTDGSVLSMKKKENGFNIDNGNLPTMFVFFTTWCPPCLAQIPLINIIDEKYKGYLQVITIIADENKEKEMVNNFVKNNNIKNKVVSDESSEIFMKSLGGINGVPYILLYDATGKKTKEYSGLIPGEMLDIDIQKVIKR
ncbi:protein disulfide reductase, TlpA family [Campylobacter blaseri]|uniref:Thioredoxin domain-containing protein n=1 Tax=Campylobacter blaseri TaxID=2042961 RepID=A0A2P8QZ39_9BACT|nr:TlpA disulfide reductase family protein [Campylobacter blaseri]PSM51513.1 hypothetical protein CQ405_08085 [Campylobacter blaseri]PSM52962.1 hypothetical protein CRN67_08090 [Campylobacter blaseri]QKF86473.1 protein disulfide reductase, TlpA family [Campylobacter blaseri]